MLIGQPLPGFITTFIIMDCKSTRITYKQTGSFSKLMVDYLDQVPALRPFFEYKNNWEGFEAALKDRQRFSTDRAALVEHLHQQYSGIELNDRVKKNIESLLQPGTYTVVTAHQPNLLTGPLYFFYKIFHAIRIAEEAGKKYPVHHFVPVYYMGNEDADLDELGHFVLNGEKFNWDTQQTGAVGRMKVDDKLISLITRAEGQVRVLPNGGWLMDQIRSIFQKGKTIQQATMELVNLLFADYGLVVMIADSRIMKQQAIPVFEKELFGDGASSYVLETTDNLHNNGYKVQAHPRAINLFYLSDGIRNRIEKVGDYFEVVNTDIRFTETELREELHNNPHHFSPNVILRGIYQETLLPNVAFVGGGGETAYWLQLKSLFKAYNVFYPVLVARNSFMLLNEKQDKLLNNMKIESSQLFMGEEKLMEWWVQRETGNAASLANELREAEGLYQKIRSRASEIDPTLAAHVEALEINSLTRLQQLEKKMLRAEKRKYSDQKRQLESLFSSLFPNGGLQERVENFMPFYGRWGKEWMQEIYKASGTFEQEFGILVMY